MYRFRVSEEGFRRRRDGCRLRQSYWLGRNVDSFRCHGRFHSSQSRYDRFGRDGRHRAGRKSHLHHFRHHRRHRQPLGLGLVLGESDGRYRNGLGLGHRLHGYSRQCFRHRANNSRIVDGKYRHGSRRGLESTNSLEISEINSQEIEEIAEQILAVARVIHHQGTGQHEQEQELHFDFLLLLLFLSVQLVYEHPIN